MSASPSYDLYSSGEIMDGFDQDQVISNFSSLFGCDAEKAAKFATSKKVIRKELDKATVDSYSQKLQGIGLGVEVIPLTPANADSSALGGLSLSPVDGAANDEPSSSSEPMMNAATGSAVVGAASGASASATASDSANFTPPQSSAKVDVDPRKDGSAKPRLERRPVEKKSSSMLGIVGPIIGAVIGAVVWAMILKTIGYELGLIAIGVGALVGFGAKMTKFDGMGPAVFCAILVAASIFGGKYIGYSMMLSEYSDGYSSGDVTDEVIAETQEWGEVYKMEAAEWQVLNKTEENVSDFMYNNDYSETEVSSAEDIEYFQAYVVPTILAHSDYSADNPQPTYEKLAAAWSEESTPYSVGELVMSGMGMMDLLFLFIGMGGAFRMVSDDED